ncbi:MAG: RNA-binding protein [Halobacteriales archaeon]
MEIRSRHHLRDDEADEVRDALSDALGVAPADGASIEEAEVDDGPDLYLVDGEPLVVRVDGDYFVTVQGALAFEPDDALVTVDAGAVEFVTNGADVMRPGVVDADDNIEEDDLVVVVEENHGKPLAVGRALTDGDDMVGDEGRVVESIYHVGDDLWEFEP